MLKWEKSFLEIDRLRYPKNPVMINYDENNYLDKYRGSKFLYREYFGEPMLTPIITNDKMKDLYPFQKIDLRFRVDHISPKKIKLSEEYGENPISTILFLIPIKHRKSKLISDGTKIVGLEVI